MGSSVLFMVKGGVHVTVTLVEPPAGMLTVGVLNESSAYASTTGFGKLETRRISAPGIILYVVAALRCPIEKSRLVVPVLRTVKVWEPAKWSVSLKEMLWTLTSAVV